ncbi:winged helix-turn-helix transcriptional regulator [Blautia liquoris]|uniref:Winged helix-turn-helix transcriptional regulator n=1 Tax=Blautia liquoris TaxID=2779518 RepID=A0A7M2RG36_9FIRM|nr:winged helix-turn-helix transcriptional regulator [Blautia liquoris]QOV19229.1 winged helix-turn-helix transcriptional regulator [Blautia liquoris]
MELTQNVAKDGKKDNESVQDKLLALLIEDNKISAKSAAEKLDMSERQIQRLLKTMKDDGIIERSGSNRNGTWNVL